MNLELNRRKLSCPVNGLSISFEPRSGESAGWVEGMDGEMAIHFEWFDTGRKDASRITIDKDRLLRSMQAFGQHTLGMNIGPICLYREGLYAACLALDPREDGTRYETEQQREHMQKTWRIVRFHPAAFGYSNKFTLEA